MNNDSRGYMNKKTKLKKYKNFKDITKEYFDNSIKNKGNIDYETISLSLRAKKEIKIAEILFSNFGGDIFIIDERLHDKDGFVSDVMWLENLWEFKNPSSYSAIDKRVRKGLKQIKKNPGGLVLEISNKLNIKKAIEIVNNRVNNSKNIDYEFDVIFIYNGEIVCVINYKL